MFTPLSCRETRVLVSATSFLFPSPCKPNCLLIHFSLFLSSFSFTSLKGPPFPGRRFFLSFRNIRETIRYVPPGFLPSSLWSHTPDEASIIFSPQLEMPVVESPPCIFDTWAGGTHFLSPPEAQEYSRAFPTLLLWRVLSGSVETFTFDLCAVPDAGIVELLGYIFFFPPFFFFI